MVTVPRLPEPSIETLKRYAKNYESGIQQAFFGDSTPIKETILAKQGMSQYAWEEWKTYDIAHRDLQVATGDIDWIIEGWVDGDFTWDDVLEKYETHLEIVIK